MSRQIIDELRRAALLPDAAQRALAIDTLVQAAESFDVEHATEAATMLLRLAATETDRVAKESELNFVTELVAHDLVPPATLELVRAVPDTGDDPGVSEALRSLLDELPG